MLLGKKMEANREKSKEKLSRYRRQRGWGKDEILIVEF